MSRFDYVKYDDAAQVGQDVAKDLCQKLEMLIEATPGAGRSKALAITKLEETYMWIGKAIRDSQLERQPKAP